MEKKPAMWIMKITPDDKKNTAQYFKKLFLEKESPKVIGYYKDNGKIEEFKNRFIKIQIDDIIIVMEGMQTVHGCVIVTSDAYDKTPDWDLSDWFEHCRKAELLKAFTPFQAKSKTNRDTIIEYSGEGAKSICDEVWDLVKNDYEQIILKNMLKPYINLLKQKHQIILQGAPGTGKTRLAKQIAEEMTKEDGESTLIQFHPAYSYEDFIRGIVAKTNEQGSISYEVENKILGTFAKKAQENSDKVYVLIIDEINRANLPVVLGELIYALEYRNKPVNSLYELNGSREIILPKNLYIIGTMNTVDRSVGHIDYAIRRRFAFVSVPPNEDVITDDKAKKLFTSIKEIFVNHLSPEFQQDDIMIGHSYFLGDAANLNIRLKYEIKPLLREYVKDGILTCNISDLEKLNV